MVALTEREIMEIILENPFLHELDKLGVGLSREEIIKIVERCIKTIMQTQEECNAGTA